MEISIPKKSNNQTKKKKTTRLKSVSNHNDMIFLSTSISASHECSLSGRHGNIIRTTVQQQGTHKPHRHWHVPNHILTVLSKDLVVKSLEVEGSVR